ncbi:MAG: sensor histidine kinase [Candidatus Eremiobacteraeota bacterium]|nr:sensor histidine kinase [Candidatus Eremiobacteraeota bacterium]MBC5803513.1 sensor histidine kinase [Candidatus Eremiobacteraeota bacterium]MBC5821799.1 sensor histidine kinase [Candidatus Eremiobacteraeota bacterium]
MAKRGQRPGLRLLPSDEGYLSYVWLVYMGWTFVYPAVIGSLSIFIETAVAAVVFLVLYFRGHWVRGRTLLAILVAIAAIGAVVGPANPWASTYFVYAAAFAPYVGSTVVAWRIVGTLIAAIALEAFLLHLTPWFWAPGTLFTALVGAVTIRAAEVDCANAKLRVAHDEVERIAKVAERERIARDLHDVLGHTLSVIVLKSELAVKLSQSDVPRAAAEIRDVERIARESLSELRQALAGYRASGLAAEIDRARDVLSAAGVRFECDIDDVRLAPKEESVLALAIREGITNVVRHAGASMCRLQLARDAHGCRVTIVDDGRGTVASDGLGLMGMRERIEALGGTVAREVTNGTQLVLTVPVARTR